MYVHESIVICIGHEFSQSREIFHTKPGERLRGDTTQAVNAVDCVRPNNKYEASLELTPDAKDRIDQSLPKPKDIDFVLILGPDDVKWYVADYIESKAIKGLKIEVADAPGMLTEEEICGKLDERFRKWSADEHSAQREAEDNKTVRNRPAKKTRKRRSAAK